MKDEKKVSLQGVFERITRRWWFFLALFLFQMVPPFAAKPFGPEQSGVVIGEILSGCYAFQVPYLYTIFKVIPIFLVGLILWEGNRFTRVFDIYAGINYMFIAVLQSVGQTEHFGLGVVVTNLIMFLLVAGTWFWDAGILQNDFASQKWNSKMMWVVPLALLAFWFPANATTFQPDFNLLGIFTNIAGLTFCMMTPLYLGVLLLCYPRVNFITLRVTSAVGTIIALYNVFLNFILNPHEFWWNGVLHIPLLVISVVALVCSLRKRPLQD